MQTIHELTKAGYTQLRVDFEDWVGMKAYTTYSEFNVGGAQDKYNLTVGGYKGTAGEWFEYRLPFWNEKLEKSTL